MAKVYLQYPWKFPDSAYYKHLIENPPEGIEYLNTRKQKGVLVNRKMFWLSNFLKNNVIRGTLNFLKISFPNAHLSPKGDYDLIHCAHCLSKNLDNPWVADFEGTFQFYIGNKTEAAKKKVREILLRENCKKILPWTKTAADEIVKEFPEIESKVEVVYPAMPFPNYKKIEHKGINLLFIGRYFYAKGGLETLEVFDYLTKKYDDVYGICISAPPEEIVKKFSNNKKIEFYTAIPQEKLFEIYSKADILIYPGYSDSFGFAFLEAMAFGLPIVTVDGFARREIVEDGKNGFVIERPEIAWKINSPPEIQGREETIQKIIEKTETLIKNESLRKIMAQHCIEEIKNGKFSIKERNKKLKRIYEEAL